MIDDIITALEELILATEFAANEVKIRNEQLDTKDREIEKLRAVADKMAKLLVEIEIGTEHYTSVDEYRAQLEAQESCIAEYDKLTSPC